MNKFALSAILLVFFGSCIKSEPRPIRPIIFKTQSAYGLSQDTVNQISANVAKFCQVEGRNDVSRMVIQVLDKSNEILVVYLCLGDPGGVGEDGDGRRVPYAVHKIDNVTYTNFRTLLSK